MKLRHISLTISNRFIDPFAQIWPQTIKAFSSEICRQIDFAAMGAYPSLWVLCANRTVVDFSVDLPENPNVFSGKAVINKFDDFMDHDGRFTRECSMDSVGELRVKLGDLSSDWMI